jgi:CheY-like chemotaxis protein
MMDALNGTSPKPKVLIVDDEPLVRMTIADMLRLGGFDVFEAAAGAQALQLLAAERPVAALVTDVRMPGMDGVDLSHRVREAHPQMPIVLVSGDTRPDAALLPAGTRYLRKPPSSRELITAVFQAIAAMT